MTNHFEQSVDEGSMKRRKLVFGVNDDESESFQQVTRSRCVLSEEIVYFGWDCHPSTAKWLEIIQIFTDNTLRFPEWEDSICGMIQDLLAQYYNSTQLFSHLKDQYGAPATSFQFCKVVPATDEEILKQTKEQFLENRLSVKHRLPHQEE